MKVLVVGVQPLSVGVDIVRILQSEGSFAVTVHDPDGASVEELRKQLSETSAPPAVLESLEESAVLQFDAAVFTDTPRHDLVRFNELLHHGGRVFVAADVLGLVGSVFVDRGSEGEKPAAAPAEGLGPRLAGEEVSVESLAQDGWVEVDADAPPLRLSPGDSVAFSALRGKTLGRLNGRPMRVAECDEKRKSRFRLDLSAAGVLRGASLEEHRARTGLVGKIDQSREGGWMTLREAIVSPSPERHRASVFPETEPVGEPRSAMVHVAVQGVHAFRQRHGYLPQLDSADHGAESALLAASFLSNQLRVNKLKPGTAMVIPVKEPSPRKWLSCSVAQYARSSHPKVRELVAAVVAQELRPRGGGGLFQPTEQNLYVDALEVLPESKEEELPPAREVMDPSGSFSKSIPKQLAPLERFLREQQRAGAGTKAGTG